jgi:hypothetical protein
MLTSLGPSLHACDSLQTHSQLLKTPPGCLVHSPGTCFSNSTAICSDCRHFFYGRRGDSFLELGGYNGCAFSNTLLLEAGAGWRVCFGKLHVTATWRSVVQLCEKPHGFLKLLHASCCRAS